MQLLGTSEEDSDFVPLLPIKDEPLSEGEQLQLSDEASETSGVGVGGEGGEGEARSSPGSKGWAPRDMECALQALRDRRMSLTKASATYGIPSTTLWQRAHRLGIDTPKKDGGAKSWSDADLRAALHALRAGALSANKASKAYGQRSLCLIHTLHRSLTHLGHKNLSDADLRAAQHALRTGALFANKASKAYELERRGPARCTARTARRRARRQQGQRGLRSALTLSHSQAHPLTHSPGRKNLSDADLRAALHALRAGALSANKASKAYGIPSSTLYKIARREGIRLAAPFNAAPTSWHRSDLQHALAAIRCGAASVQRAAAQFGIPTGTLYGRCKREGIELSRSNPTPWSEDAMGEALEAVRVGQMSINQAAIHYNLPYSSLYGRFKRCKYQLQGQPVHQSKMEKNIEIDHQHQHQDQEPFSYHSLPPHADPNTSDDQTNVQIPYSQLLSEVHDTMHGHMVLQEQYSGQGLYYTQGYYSGMATS
ncbi:unnamed protein product [Parnassius apollo]|uniref:(apollo) hypothetical protein n=1 Tax=Parnassius apollo TaxID=110799 RepID=A0A8S3WJ27_PARAO|nr:unnamed protein product [Parnassius apollo]